MPMKVTLRHRQADAGSFFVDCEVRLSEEERSIIQHRGLGNHTITVPSGIPFGSGLSPHSRLPDFWAKYVGKFFFIIGALFLLGGIASSVALLFGLVCMAIFFIPVIWMRFAIDRRIASQQDQVIPLQQFLFSPVFTVAAT